MSLSLRGCAKRSHDGGTGLYWTDKDRSMGLLKSVVEGEAYRSMSAGAEALLTLSGGAALMEDCAKEILAGADDAPMEGPSWAMCELCGRPRQTKRWLPVWWRFSCGDPEATYPRLTCGDSSTFTPPRCIPALPLGPGCLLMRARPSAVCPPPDARWRTSCLLQGLTGPPPRPWRGALCEGRCTKLAPSLSDARGYRLVLRGA